MERSELLLDTAKFEGVFDSISTTLVEQTSVLRSMYNLDLKKLEFDKEAKKDAARDRALKVDEAAVQTETQSNNNTNSSLSDAGSSNLASGLASLVGGALSGISMAGLGALVVKGGFLALVAPKIGEFISGAVKGTLDGFNPPGKKGDATDEFNKSIGDGLGKAFTYGWIGSLFGKRVALIAAAGGFVGSFSDEIVKKFGNEDKVIEMFGKEFDDDAVSNILTAIGGAIALVAPMVIRKALPKLFSRYLASAAVVGAAAGAVALDKDGNKVSAKPRNFTQKGTHADGSPRLFNSKGKEMAPNTSQYKASRLAYDQDKDLMSRLRKSKYRRLARLSGVLGSVISMGFLASILLNENIDDDEKIELIGRELGTIFGGVGGAALGTAAGLALGFTSGPGMLLTGIGGGIAGAFAGEWLGTQIASGIVGSKTDFDELPADIENSVMMPTGTDMPVTVAPRPTESGQMGDYARNDWDRLFGEKYKPSGILKPELLMPPISKSNSATPILGPDQVIDKRYRRLQSLESNAGTFGDQAQASILLAEGSKTYKAGNNSSVTNITNITKVDSSPSLSNTSGLMTAFT